MLFTVFKSTLYGPLGSDAEWAVAMHPVGVVEAPNEKEAIEAAKRQGFTCPIVEAQDAL